MSQRLMGAGVFVCSGLSILSAACAFADTPVSINAQQHYQTMDGFGTALAWWMDQPYSSQAFQNMYFKDMGASMLRMEMQITALSSDRSDNPSNADMSTPITFGADTYQNIAKFNFNAVGVRNAGNMAQAGASMKLDDFKFIGSLWTPPQWMKGPEVDWSGNVVNASKPNWDQWNAQNSDGGSLIDTPENLQQFGRYVTAYVKGMQETYGVPMYAISIQNELVFSQPYNSAVYSPSLYVKAVDAVQAAFDAHNAMYPNDPILTKIEGPEDVGVGTQSNPWILWRQMQFINAVRADPIASKTVSIYSIHGYAGDGSSVGSVSDAAVMWGQYQNGRSGDASWTGIAADNKPAWMTEASGQNPAWLHTDGNGNPDGAFSIALNIHDALVHGNVSAYLYWQMTDTTDSTAAVGGGSLVSGTDSADSKKYAAAKQFFRFIRPGSVRLGTTFSDQDGLKISAFGNDSDQSLTMVLINDNPDAQTLDIDLDSLLARYPLASLQEYRTDLTENFAQLPDVIVSNRSVSVTLPAYSVVTLNGSADPSRTVPEPTMLGALGVIGLTSLKRRRRS